MGNLPGRDRSGAPDGLSRAHRPAVDLPMAALLLLLCLGLGGASPVPQSAAHDPGPGARSGLPTAQRPGAPLPGAGIPSVLINELDADQPGVDGLEFIEFITTEAHQDLSGLVVVLYNGAAADDVAYAAHSLDGQTSDEQGLFVLGSAPVPGVDLVVFTRNGLQNGPDAVALWQLPVGRGAEFMGTQPSAPPAGAVLLDALVYGTSDAPDSALLEALTPGASLADESPTGAPADASLQRRPDGGRPVDPARFVASPPTPGRLNGTPQTASIHDIQGAGHRSPLAGRLVTDVEGVVTAVRSVRYFLQQVPGSEDDDPATSEAIVVLNGGAPSPAVGDRLRVSGWVDEHPPGNSADNLTTTRLAPSAPWVLIASEQPLPEPVVLGVEGRPLPDRVIDDDTEGGALSVGPTHFDPEADGLDYFEALEGMRVEVREAVAVSLTSGFGEVVVVADGGRAASGFTQDGFLVRRADDPNPERIVVDDALHPVPPMQAGQAVAAPLQGVLGYSFGQPKLLLTEAMLPAPPPTAHDPVPEPEPGHLRVASLNVQNLSPLSDPARVAGLAHTLVHNLGAPDLVALQEVQDDSGPAGDGTVSATATLALLRAAILEAGGPAYQALEIAPENGHDGGQPGGNIRVAYLLRADGALTLVERPGGDALTAVSLSADAAGRPQLRPSPGRIAPTKPAWKNSRKPLVAQFRWGAQTLFVVTLHFRSKLGDKPLFGDAQPPPLGSEQGRTLQALAVADFSAELLGLQPAALLIVLGDFNDFAESVPLQLLEGRGGLVNLTPGLPWEQQYSYVFAGNAQVLDHVLVSPALATNGARLRFVHVHAGRPGAPSDHDPLLLSLPAPSPRPGPGPDGR